MATVDVKLSQTAPPPSTDLSSKLVAPHPQPTDLTPPSSQSGPEPRMSTASSVTATDPTTPPFSPSSATPVLEKYDEDLDFAGNVDVNDDKPTETELQRAGELFLQDNKGHSLKFKDLYNPREERAPLQLVIFIRHFFCGNCQEYLRTLSSSVTPESLLALPTPASISVIGCGKPELIDMYAETTGCQFPIYAEPTRKLYDILGMTRTWDLGKKPEYIQSNLIVTSVQSIVQGLKTGSNALKGGDFKQVGGEFLFEDGKLTWVHRMRNTRDHYEVEKLRGILGLQKEKAPPRRTWSHSIKKEKEGGRSRSSSWGRFRSLSKGARDASKSRERKERNSVEKPNV